MKPNNPAKRKYLDSTFRKGLLRQKVISREQAMRMTGDDVDLQINEATGEASFKNKDGKRQKLQNLGTRLWTLLLDVLWAEGDLVELRSENHVNALVRRLRKAFSDDVKHQWFFITRRDPSYALRANIQRNWRILEVLATPGEEKSK